MVANVRRGRIEMVAVWSLDRLASSLHRLLQLAEELNAMGVELVSLNQSVDTSTRTGP